VSPIIQEGVLKPGLWMLLISMMPPAHIRKRAPVFSDPWDANVAEVHVQRTDLPVCPTEGHGNCDISIAS
jgi:hypothetical protein